MDKLIFDISPIIIGRTEDLPKELSERNASYFNLCKDIKSQRNYLKENLDKPTWVQVKSLIRLYMKKNLSDTQYLYCQGMKDCAFLSNYIESDLINPDFMIEEVDDDFWSYDGM